MAIAPVRPSLRARRPAVGVTTRAGRTVTDEALVAAAAQGDESALVAIHDRYRAPLERYCRTILLEHADAEDAAQAALASGLRALADRRSEPESLRAWLYRIAHNEALGVLRRRPPVAVGDPSDDALAALLPSAPDRVADRADLGELLDDLRALPERQRCALVLHELGGLRHEEIADTLGLASPGAARQAVHAARTALRRRRTDDLHVLFPAAPALALVAGVTGAGAGAGVGGGLAAGGAGGLGVLGAWLTGAGVATKCAAVCAAVGAIGAGSLAVVEAPHVPGLDRPAAKVERAPEREAPAMPRAAASTAAGGTTAATAVPAVSPAAARAEERRAEARREAVERRSVRRRAEARRRTAERQQAQAERDSAAAPAAAPDVDGVDVSGDAGAGTAPAPSPSPPAATAEPTAAPTPVAPATRRAAGPAADVVVTDTDVGGLVDETGVAVTDVVVDAG